MREAPYIIIAGERYEVPRAVNIVRWSDPGMAEQWGFYRSVPFEGGLRSLTSPRALKGKRVTSLDDLQEVVTQVLLHADCTATAQACYRVLVSRALSTHFMLDWDGTLYQGADLLDRTYHGGDANNLSIGIDLNNHMRPERPDDLGGRRYVDFDVGKIAGLPPGWKDQKRQLSEPMRIQNAVKRCFGYTDEQYTTLIALLQVLANVFPGMRTDPAKAVLQPPMDETGEVIGTAMPDAAGWKGLLAHWHWSSMKWDPGPGFDWQRVYHGMRGEANAFPIEIGEPQGSPLTAEDMLAQSEPYYENCEQRVDGGYFPVGVNQTWHGGIHLTGPRGSRVNAMLPGQVVLARVGVPTPLGSNSFVLLRHDLDMPKPGEERPEDFTKLKIYSLYMHLDEVDLGKPESWPGWMKKAITQAQATEAGAMTARHAIDERMRLARVRDPDGAPQSLGELEGSGFPALAKGQVARFGEKGDEAIYVIAGEQLGGIGLFGSRRELAEQVHVELFTDESWRGAIDLGVHARHWYVLDEPEPGEQRVRNRQVVRLMGGGGRPRLGQRGFLLPGKELSQDAIRRFYRSDAAEAKQARTLLRRAIVRYTSEWSDQVDWLRALSEEQEWAAKVQDLNRLLQDRRGQARQGVFTRDVQDILRFTWLTASVAAHIGLEPDGAWDGMVYHFHPLHFLQWLSFHSSSRIRVLAKGLSRKQLAKRFEEDRRKMQEQLAPIDVTDAMLAAREEFRDESTIVNLAVEMPNPRDPFRSLDGVGRRVGRATWRREEN